MFKHNGSIQEKFTALKKLGYDGVEINTPCPEEKKKEFINASQATGLPIHGSVNSRHWKTKLSDKDPTIRAQAVKNLKQCIQDTYDVGGSSVLLVPGKVDDKKGDTHDLVWKRSIEGIRQCLPLASKLGIHILIETVWNDFCTSPEKLKQYIDEINSPWCRVYFDIGNMEKYAPPAQWIRVLGNRIVKLDVKGWGRKKGFGKIGSGDVNWPEVCKALREIGFTGWSTAEVRGGDEKRIQEIAQNMTTFLEL